MLIFISILIRSYFFTGESVDLSILLDLTLSLENNVGEVNIREHILVHV